MNQNNEGLKALLTRCLPALEISIRDAQDYGDRADEIEAMALLKDIQAALSETPKLEG